MSLTRHASHGQDLRVHILTWVHISILILLTATIFLVIYVNPPDSPLRLFYTVLIVSLLVLFTAAYFLLRSDYYFPSAGLTIAGAVIGPWASFIADPAVLAGDFFPLVYVSISIVLSSIFLPLAVTAALAALQFAALVLVVLLVPAAQQINWPSFLAFIFYISALSILINYISSKDRAYIERQLKRLRLAHKELHQKESFYSAVLDNLPTGISVHSVTPGQTIKYINKAFHHIYRIPEGAVTDYDAFWKAVYKDPKQREEIRRQVETDIASGNPDKMHWEQVPIVRKDQETRYITASNTPIPEKNLMISTVWDVTEQVRIQEQLIRGQKMESIGRLAGGIAHDFNNLLGVILGYTEMAIERVSSDQPLHSDLKEIYSAAEHSAALTRQLLAFTRQLPTSPKTINLHTTIQDMLNMLRKLIGENVTLSWKPGKGVSAITIDPSHMNQILVNLCINAREAISDIGMITIETRQVHMQESDIEKDFSCRPGEYVQITVSDNGCGMDRETMSHLFEPFFTTKGGEKGTGLGLATVYGIVQQHNGCIHAESEPGKGSTFRIYFPAAAEETVRDTSAGTMQADTPADALVMLVDDDAVFQAMAGKMLEQMGYTVTAVHSPRKAMEVSEELNNLDLLITDVVMPEMNGKELYQKLHKKFPHLKCLYMSGYTSHVITHRGIHDEGIGFIQKPFTKEELQQSILTVLGAQALK